MTTGSTMTEIPLVERLEAGANSIAVDGTPSQVGPTAEELHQAAAMLKAAVEALRPFASHVGKSGEVVTLSIGKDTWTRTLTTDDFERARNTLATLKQQK